MAGWFLALGCYGVTCEIYQPRRQHCLIAQYMRTCTMFWYSLKRTYALNLLCYLKLMLFLYIPIVPDLIGRSLHSAVSSDHSF